MKKNLCKLTVCCLVFAWHSLAAQTAQDTVCKDNTQKDRLLFSGVVLENNQEAFVPYTHIYIINKGAGSISNKDGYFTFYAHKGDSMRFSALGFQDAYFVIPDSISTGRCAVVQLLSQDTVMLAETIIYPWPVNTADFKNAFLHERVQDDKIEQAKKNLAISAIKHPRQVVFDQGDAAYNFDADMQTKAYENYTVGQLHAMPILDPIAWWKFIRAWRRGDFKNKKKK